VNIVAIETATETVGVAVRTADGAEVSFTLHGRRRHAETLAPALEHLLAQVGLAPAGLQVVAVDIGPGLFTGLRVGVAAAKGLAQALGIGVVGVSSLDILGRAAAERGHRGRVLAAVDARRGEVFATVAQWGGSTEAAAGPAARPFLGPGLFSPGELARALTELGGAPILGVGDGVQRYAGVLGAVAGISCVMDALGAPPPLTLLATAMDLLEAGTAPAAPQSVVPLYMRAADATSNFARAGTT
jgi:tRNA threonylcarbamoyladenosine biosynthesis protein TsaB